MPFCPRLYYLIHLANNYVPGSDAPQLSHMDDWQGPGHVWLTMLVQMPPLQGSRRVNEPWFMDPNG